VRHDHLLQRSRKGFELDLEIRRTIWNLVDKSESKRLGMAVVSICLHACAEEDGTSHIVNTFDHAKVLCDRLENHRRRRLEQPSFPDQDVEERLVDLDELSCVS
jgi:hypothetical protein